MQPDDPDRARFDEPRPISFQESAGQGGASTAALLKFPGDEWPGPSGPLTCRSRCFTSAICQRVEPLASRGHRDGL